MVCRSELNEKDFIDIICDYFLEFGNLWYDMFFFKVVYESGLCLFCYLLFVFIDFDYI